MFFFVSILTIRKILNIKLWLPIIIFIGLISRVILIPSTPVLEDDYYRYLWDGAVTAHLYNPYEYSPHDVVNNVDGIPAELNRLSVDAGIVVQRINHPHIRTIYPVLSQIAFAVAYYISPWQNWSWKIVLLLSDLLLLIILLKTLKYLQLPLILVAIYWLNPIVIHEIFNGGHMDLLALLPVALSLYFLLKERFQASVIFLAFAVGVKLWPLVLLPLILQKAWPEKKVALKLTGIFAAIVLVLFIPVLTTTIDSELGFVIYADKWINNAAFYTIFQWVIQQVVQVFPFTGVCLSCINRIGIVLLFTCIAILIYKKPANNLIQQLNKGILVVAVLYLIGPTQFPWYYTWVVPMMIVRPKISFLLYVVLLPLYQLNYLSGYFIYIQHIPILILFILEARGLIWKNYWDFLNHSNIKVNLAMENSSD